MSLNSQESIAAKAIELYCERFLLLG